MRLGLPTGLPQPRHFPNYPPRRSTEDATSHRRKPISPDLPDDPLNPEDFSDVFGGPPRTILSRQFSTAFPRSSSSTGFFYEEIFRPSEKRRRPLWGGAGGACPSSGSLVNKQRVITIIKNVKLIVSTGISLRGRMTAWPLNVRARWSSRRIGHDDYQRQQNMMPPFAGTRPIYNAENDFPFGLSRRNASPETISLEPMSNGSFRVSADDLKLNSPSSAVSSVCQSDREQTTREIEEEILRQDAMEQDEDESMSSYVIEINSDIREGHVNQMLLMKRLHGQKRSFKLTATRIILACKNVGKINPQKSRILWSDSGWSPVPLANIIEIPKVKKAYQRARLCLHPDKLQQRSATHQQKYIAEKAFSVLQDAWAVFISTMFSVDDLKSCSQIQSVAVKEEKNQ
ncbi:UNVERIFIED_CONTAM: J domain-containing protein required for chloroplast accumulation response 1 [Sesamum calycinum]|uniref:J domain-containing protein required for chloroplast accumulation response 1 n=1 Tax=Sesamum calycinum TaxID=2727403 RepID=A0AAW2Q7W7_9LAMI